MSEATEPRPADPVGQRSPRARADDHAAIDRLAGELLPALVAKLAATGLGELEVREGDWRVRLRRPGGAVAPVGRRISDRPSRTQPGHEGHGHPPAAVEGHRSARGGMGAHSTNGSSPPSGRPVGPGHQDPEGEGRPGGTDPHRAVATSPAVGIFQPRPEARPGSRVRAGDRIGVVDMLGVAQDVVAPADGIIASILVDAGDAVEYGQELVAIELATHATGGGSPAGAA